jgi:hypothetical protein
LNLLTSSVSTYHLQLGIPFQMFYQELMYPKFKTLTFHMLKEYNLDISCCSYCGRND